MRFATFVPYNGPLSTPESVVQFTLGAEELGFHHVRIGEHMVFPKEIASKYPYAADGKLVTDPTSNELEPFTTFAFLAARTSRIRFHTSIVILPLRSPFVTARMAATLDYLSGGRFGMGVGAGWMQEEYDAVGVSFAERFRLTDEYLAVIRELFDGGGPYEGSVVSFPALDFEPKPVQRPFPVYIGSGIGPRSLRRVAKYGQGWTPHGIELDDTPQALQSLQELMAAEGRGGERIVVEGAGGSGLPEQSSAGQILERLQKMASVGYDSAVMDFGQMRAGSLTEVTEAMSWFAREVMSEAANF